MSGARKFGNQKVAARMKRKTAIRKKIVGTSERPRVTVFRSLKHIYAQAIDDSLNQVIATSSDCQSDISEADQGKKKTEVSYLVGMMLAKKLLEKNVGKVVFDRNGYIYHGRVRAVADGIRKGGLNF